MFFEKFNCKGFMRLLVIDKSPGWLKARFQLQQTVIDWTLLLKDQEQTTRESD